jgi:hypothetical protein
MAIQDDKTILSKQDLKEYHNRILPYLGGNMMMSTNVATYYDENEKIIGSYNGKPLYQKTFTRTAPTCTTDGVEANVGNLPLGFRLDTLVDAESIITNTVGIARPLPNLKFQDNKLKLVRYWVYTDSAEDTAQRNTYGFVNSWTQENGGTIKLTLRYTKATDTANSALTTPGCYDLNRPDLWPANKEIFFSNGLYGRRCTGNLPATAVNSGCTVSLFSSQSSSIKIVNMGGGFNVLGVHDNNYSLGYITQDTSPFNLITNTVLFYSSSKVMRLRIATGPYTNLTTDNTYDVWVTYKK